MIVDEFAEMLQANGLDDFGQFDENLLNNVSEDFLRNIPEIIDNEDKFDDLTARSLMEFDENLLQSENEVKSNEEDTLISELEEHLRFTSPTSTYDSPQLEYQLPSTVIEHQNYSPTAYYTPPYQAVRFYFKDKS